jgi:uncharacterized protein
MSSSRAPIVDALRGIALFGILVVNIQSFVWGIDTATLGRLYADSAIADRVTVLFTAMLFEFKFYPIFCFCFGYGFAVQSRKWIARGQDAPLLFWRRIIFMMIVGAFHGIFIWFGDILTRYGVTALILRRHLGKGNNKGPKKLLRVLRFWLIIALALAIVISALSIPDLPISSAQDESTEVTTLVRTIYTSGTWLDITQQRLKDYFTVLGGFVFLFPLVLCLFLMGAITAHAGWLRRPEKYRALWLRILLVSALIGLPMNVLYTQLGYNVAQNAWDGLTFFHLFSGYAMPFVSAMYVAIFALLAPSLFGRALIALFAPAGKFALTHYLFQSILLSFLLYGYGFAMGGKLHQAQLFILACAIYAFQLLVSHLYLHTGKQGPAEWLWRRFIGGGGASTSRTSGTLRSAAIETPPIDSTKVP